MTKNRSALSWILLCFLSIVWGSSFILIKKSLLAFTPLQVASFRISIATLAFVPFLIPRLKEVKPHEWKYLLIVGLTGFGVPAFLFALAQTKIPSSVAGILNSLSPLFTLILGVIFFATGIVMKRLVGVLIGFAGAAVLILFGDGELGIENLEYPIYIVLATIMYALSVNTVKSKLQEMNAVTISAVSFALIGPTALCYTIYIMFTESVHMHQDFAISMGSVVILALSSTVLASILFWKLVQMTNAIFSSSVAYMIPLVATLFGLFDGESITVFHFLAMMLILLGVALSRGKDA